MTALPSISEVSDTLAESPALMGRRFLRRTLALAVAGTALSGCSGTERPSGPSTPGPAAKLAFGVQPANAIARALIAPAVQVLLQDAQGNSVPDAQATVTLSITAGTGTPGAMLSGSVSRPTANGVATFVDIAVDTPGSGYTLTATASALSGVISGRFEVGVGSASKLEFLVQPSTATAGAAMAPSIRVAVQDAFGNIVTPANTGITIAISLGAGIPGAVLGGSPTQPAMNGVATFSDLTIDRAGTGYSLTATATNLAAATSNAFAVAPGAPAKLLFTRQPTDLTAGTSITPPVLVTVQDAHANTVTSATTNVSLAITAGTGTAGAVLSGTLNQAASSGVASFGNLVVNRTGTGYTLTASATSVADATSAAFSVFSGQVASLRKLAGDSQVVTVGTLANDSLTVEAADQFGNTVPGATVSWSAPGGATTQPTQTTTTSAGRSSASVRMGPTIGTQAVTASSGPANAVFALTGTRWLANPPYPTAWYRGALVELGGRIFAMGGTTGAAYASRVLAFDTTARAWTDVGPIQTPRYDAAAAVLYGRIYLLGGNNTTSSNNALATVESFDPATGTWAAHASMPTAHRDFPAVALGGFLYAVGGANANANSGSALERYDPSTNSWTILASLPTPLSSHAAAAVGGIIYVLGGNDGTQASATVYAYNPFTNSWSTVTSMPTTRSYARAAVVAGTVYIAGGCSYVGGQTGCEYYSVQQFDPGSLQFVEVDRLLAGRYLHAVAASATTVYVLGGLSVPGGQFLNSLEALTP